MVAHAHPDPRARRLRLTIANGHGLNALLDDRLRDEHEDRDQLQHDEALVPTEPAPDEEAAPGKAAQRAQWWMEVLDTAFADEGASLYAHPGILATVQAVEAAHSEGEKVLVFGRYTLPMRRLVALLNAREMLRRLDAGETWPQAAVHDDDEWQAVQAAHRQLGRPGAPDRHALDEQLHQQYQRLENERSQLCAHLVERLGRGMPILPTAARARALYEAFTKSRLGLAPLARALAEMLGDRAEQAGPTAWAEAFAELIEASSDRGEGDANGDGRLDPQEAGELWQTLAQQLHEEYDRPQGGFARIMHGETRLRTRRLLQMAFNRPHSFPQVLVAQSVVGREGLNLHRACRTVVLLHPEWNPGVVEQQIGRVDRVGSRWEQLLDEALAAGVPAQCLPRIRIRPVVFKGSYDELNWQVLRRRWDELRAQLHGVVLTAAQEDDPLMAQWIKEINAAAPNFSPD